MALRTLRMLAVLAVALFGCSAKLLGCSSSGGSGPDLTSADQSRVDLSTADRAADRELGPDGPAKADGAPVKPCGFKIGTGANPTSGENTGFTIGGAKRRFLVLKENVPAGYTGKLPVVFTFHGYGGSVTSVNALAQPAAQNKPILKVVPQAIVNTAFPVWDFTSNPQESIDLRFFDEMLVCLAAELPIDLDRVHAIGGSIGAIFVDYLLTHRGDKLASVATMSGGFLPFPKSASYYYDWPYDTLLAGLKSKAAVMVYWGGPTDQGGGFDFHQGSLDAIQKLRANTHFVVRCMHDQGHDWSEQFTKFAFLFFEDHPRGVKPAPWASGLPKPPFPAPDASWPGYCSIAP